MSNLRAMLCIPGMLLFGTTTVVLQKQIFSMHAKGSHSDDEVFKKPWFQTDAMFLGMALCLVVYECTRLWQYCRKRDSNLQVQEEGKDDVQHWKYYVYVMAPAMCDLVATAFMNIGLVFSPPSVWQMLRGSMVVFSAIFSVIFLKKKLYMSHWLGVTVVIVGLILVGLSDILGPPSPEEEASPTDISSFTETMSIIMVVAAQIIQAAQIVIEEFLLKGLNCPATLIVGLEGLWGGLVCSLLLIPLQYAPQKPADERNTIPDLMSEDTVDTLAMLGNSTSLLICGISYVLAILFYNMFGMMVTQTFTAVHRTILEGLRTACIWVVELIINCVDSEKGEKLSSWSFMELAGFLMLLLGLFIYNQILVIPGKEFLGCQLYPDEEESDLEKPLAADLGYDEASDNV